MKAPKEKVTYDMVDKKLAELSRRAVEARTGMRMLRRWRTSPPSPPAPRRRSSAHHAHLAQFDISGSMSTHMPIPIWKKCVNNLIRIHQLLVQNPHITLTEDSEPEPRPPPTTSSRVPPCSTPGRSAPSQSASTTSTSSRCSPSTLTPRSTSTACRTSRSSSSSVPRWWATTRSAARRTSPASWRCASSSTSTTSPSRCTRRFADSPSESSRSGRARGETRRGRRGGGRGRRDSVAKRRSAKIAEEEGDEFLDDEDADEAEAKEARDPYPTGCTFLLRLCPNPWTDCRSSSTGATGARRRRCLRHLQQGAGRDFAAVAISAHVHLQENISQMDISTQISSTAPWRSSASPPSAWGSSPRRRRASASCTWAVASASLARA